VVDHMNLHLLNLEVKGFELEEFRETLLI